jgi:adenine-specific DNA methylase
MRRILLNAPARPEQWDMTSKTRIGLRGVALEFIGDFSHPEHASHAAYIRCARELVATVNSPARPLVLDSFAGGGSIPLESVRLACDAVGSDLNPIACLILHSELDLLPRHGEDLPLQLEQAGDIIGKRFQDSLKEYFAEEADGRTPLAYFWARQATCEAPRCGTTFPLAGAWWLCKKPDHRTAIRSKTTDDTTNLILEVFKPQAATDVPQPTVVNGRAVCPECHTPLTNDRLRFQLAQCNGGITHARLLAVVVQNEETGERHYRDATIQDIRCAERAKARACELMSNAAGVSPSPIPDETIPHTELRRVSAPLYGCSHWRDLFLPRQLLTLHLLANEIHRYVKETRATELMPLLALAYGKVLRHWNSNAKWHTKSETVAGAFGRQAIPMAYLFPEQSPLTAEGAGSWSDAVRSVASGARTVVGLGNTGQAIHADACSVPLPSGCVNVWFTDPPYYDAVAYAHLADFFYIWMRRLMPDNPLFKTPLIAKDQECVVDRPHSRSPSRKGADWFESKMASAMAEAKRLLSEEGVASVVFAHKTTEGWEAIIGAMLKADLVITASWPILTERSARLNARDNASLATSVHLICRPKSDQAPVGDWSRVFSELPTRVGQWMERLQNEGVRGADLVFACIGPSLEIYSQYSKVEDAEGHEIPLGGNPESVEPHERGFLSYVWETIGRIALEQVLGTAEAKARNGAAGAVEEDARLTALFLWTLQGTNGKNANGSQAADDTEEEVDEPDENEQEETTSRKKTKGFSLVYDVVRRFAQPLGIHLPDWEARILETKKGVVRLLAVSERAKQLFGDAGASAIADRLEEEREVSPQMLLFPEMQQTAAAPKIKGRRKKVDATVSDDDLHGHRGATTLDRVHAAMLLQASGRANALRALIKAEQQRGPDFLRLSNALSALYPTGSEEERLIDAMLLAVPR